MLFGFLLKLRFFPENRMATMAIAIRITTVATIMYRSSGTDEEDDDDAAPVTAKLVSAEEA